MERIKRALAEARRQRKELQERGRRSATPSPFRLAGAPLLRSPHGPKVLAGIAIAIATILVTTLAWLAGSTKPDKAIRLSAIEGGSIDRGESMPELARSVAAAEALSDRLASLKARVDVLDSSLSRLYDKLLEVHVRIDTMSAAGDSLAPVKATAANELESRRAHAPTRTADAAALSHAAGAAPVAGTTGSAETPAPAAAGPVDAAKAGQRLSAPAAKTGPAPDQRVSGRAPAVDNARDATQGQQAQADGDTSTTAIQGPWVINLVSLADKPSADRFAARARAKDVPVRQNQVNVKGRSYWRVQVGGFATAEEARAHADSIKAKLGLKETWISRR